MKVALLKSQLSPKGGLEKAAMGLKNAFHARGLDVSVLSTEAPFIKVSSRSRWNLLHEIRFDAACQKYLTRHPHEIVFGMERTRCQTHYRAGLGVHAVYLERRKMRFRINPFHAFLLKREKEIFESPILRKLFTNSQMVKNEILERFSLSPEKIYVVHNGVAWKSVEPAFLSRKKSPRFTFLFIGNGYKRKGLDLLLEALPENADLLVVGKDKDLPSYKRRAPRNVSFFGWQADLLPFYQRADALVIPSLYDPFAHVTVEALAMGLFVISSPFNGGKEVLEPHTGLILEDLFSRDAMRAALEYAMRTPLHPQAIRDSVKHLEFSKQLSQIVEACLC